MNARERERTNGTNCRGNSSTAVSDAPTRNKVVRDGRLDSSAIANKSGFGTTSSLGQSEGIPRITRSTIPQACPRLALPTAQFAVATVSRRRNQAPSVGKSGQVWRASVGLAVRMLSSRPSFTAIASDLPQTCRGIPSHLCPRHYRWSCERQA